MLDLISRLLKDEQGVTAIEYGLIAGLIAVAAVVSMGFAAENQVRTGLPAGGRWIRTSGSARQARVE